MIKIVTIEREYGSGGGEIAAQLAHQLGWKLWDQLLTEEIARLANCSKAAVEDREERRDPLYYRLFKSLKTGTIHCECFFMLREKIKCDGCWRAARTRMKLTNWWTTSTGSAGISLRSTLAWSGRTVRSTTR